jgi:transcriptional regulator with XRE-family HTH domain
VVWRLNSGTLQSEFAVAILKAAGAVDAFDRRILIAEGDTLGHAVPFAREARGSLPIWPASDPVSDESGSTLIAVDARRWGSAPDVRAYAGGLARCALTQGAVALWFFGEDEEDAALRGEIEDLAQCIIDVFDGQLHIERADARNVNVRGTNLPYELEDGLLSMTTGRAASLLGRGLRAVRLERGWSQAELAKVSGVSASAISQAERGQHALSLETTLELSARLGISIDRLLRGAPPPYRITREPAPGRDQPGGMRLIVASEQLGIEGVLVKIPAAGTASPRLAADGTELLYVLDGLVQVILSPDRPVLRTGDVLETSAGTVSGCRNLGDGVAQVLWIVPSAA